MVEARNLPNADWIGYADPYVTLNISAPPLVLGGEDAGYPDHARTRTVRSSLHPKWEDQVFSFVVHDPTQQFVDVRVWDSDKYGSDDLLGSARVDLRALAAGELNDDWLTLEVPERLRRRVRRRFLARRRAGLTTRRRAPEAQLRIKHVFNLFISTRRPGAEGGEGDLSDAIDTARSSSQSDFATMKHGLLGLTIVKAKVANAYVYGNVKAKVRVVQVDRYRDSESNREKLRAAESLFASERGDGVEDGVDEGEAEGAGEFDAAPVGEDAAVDVGAPTGVDLRRVHLREASFNIGVQESRAIPPAAILFKSSTTPKESDVDLRWDERFEYVLSEAEYDEDKQMERGLPPKAVVIQIILKMKGLLRQEVLGVVNVPLDDVIQSRHIERQYHVLGGLSSTTVSAVLNWQSF